MDIMLEFVGFPVLYDILPKGPSPCSFEGNTVTELLDHLMVKADRLVRESLLEQGTGMMDPAIQITVNGKFLERENFSDRTLDEGDSVTIMRLLAGG